MGGAVGLVLIGALAGAAASALGPLLVFGLGGEVPFVAGPFAGGQAFAEAEIDGFLIDGTVDDAALDIAVGDCVAGSDDADLREVACDEEHALEAFGVVAVDVVDEHPGRSSLDGSVYGLCDLRFAAYVGVSFSESEYGIVTAVPGRDAWEQGDREVTCYVASWDDQPLVGSVADSGR